MKVSQNLPLISTEPSSRNVNLAEGERVAYIGAIPPVCVCVYKRIHEVNSSIDSYDDHNDGYVIDVWFKCKKKIEKQRKSGVPVTVVRMFFRFEISNGQARRTENIKLLNGLDKIPTHTHILIAISIRKYRFRSFFRQFWREYTCRLLEDKRNTRFKDIKPKSNNDKVFEIAFSRLNFKKERKCYKSFF